MSKERELLKRFIAELKTEEDVNTQYLLDQVSRLISENAMLKEKWLSQPEQEPVAWMNDFGGCFLSDGNKYSENWTALYTAPSKREPLSYEAVCEILIKKEWKGFVDLVRIIEKAHGITGVDDE